MPQEKTFAVAYEVADDQTLYLTVIIGDGQVGASVVKLETQILGTHDIEDLEIGEGSEIRSKRLYVKTMVTDINDLTNWTSVTYRLSGGMEDLERTEEIRVDNDGDAAFFRARFDLT